MQYFASVVNFVDQNFIWFISAFLGVLLIEFIVFIARKKDEGYEWDDFSTWIGYTILVFLVLYIAACLIIGAINCLMDQDWAFWANYSAFLDANGSGIASIIFIIAGIVYLIIIPIDSFLGRLIVAGLAALLTIPVLAILGFVVYFVFAFLFIILKLIWFVVSGFFVSIFEFVVKYWLWLLIVLSIPGAIYALIMTLINYVRSFKEEVVPNATAYLSKKNI